MIRNQNRKTSAHVNGAPINAVCLSALISHEKMNRKDNQEDLPICIVAHQFQISFDLSCNIYVSYCVCAIHTHSRIPSALKTPTYECLLLTDVEKLDR